MERRKEISQRTRKKGKEKGTVTHVHHKLVSNPLIAGNDHQNEEEEKKTKKKAKRTIMHAMRSSRKSKNLKKRLNVDTQRNLYPTLCGVRLLRHVGSNGFDCAG
jgi:hypothetical protein